jgi:tripartite-type tricarboxylate transporter receptor subunit TctC
MLAQQGGLNLATAVYKGTAPALTDVAGGHTQILIDSIISLQSMAKGGKVKPIAVTSRKRSPVLPNVPTAVESGFPKFVTESWYGIWAPKGTPEPLGIEPVIESIDESRKYMQAYVTESAELLKGAGFKPE